MGRLGRLAARIAGDCRGNMVLIAAGMLVALVAVGFGLDYGRAMALQARLAEAGHAAAMGAVSRPMQAQWQPSFYLLSRRPCVSVRQNAK